jgi:hypothetical protein
MSNEKLKKAIENILSEKRKQILSKIDSFKDSIITQLDDFKDLDNFTDFTMPDGVNMENNATKSKNIDILYEFIKKISQSQDQKSLISSLMDGLKNFCNRAALFLIKDDKLVGWSGIGFKQKDGEIQNSEIKKIFFSLSANTILKQVVDKRKLFSGKPLSQADDHLIYNRFGGRYPEKILVLPLMVKGKPQAVIYTDAFDDQDLEEKEIEILSILGEMSLDLLPIKQKVFTRVQTKEYEEEEETFVSPKEDEVHVHEETAHSVSENDPDRKARVIINDIILYNKSVVDKGIKNRNLYDTLEDTILQAKEEYLRKFSNLSIFETNLIQILAKGDKELLRGYKFETQ